MGNLKIGHIIEAALWLSLAVFLYARSFGFDREIEIYKFGASGWPRAVLLLIVIAAVGQLAYNWKTGGLRASDRPEAATEAAAAKTAPDARRSGLTRAGLRRHLSTFFLLSLPFAYMVLPEWIQSWLASAGLATDKAALHTVKLVCAGVLLLLYVAGLRANMVGAMLALPVFFGALMLDIGFYFLAPFFAAGVMYLMGERRPGRIVLIAALLTALVVLLFVSVLYVGLPTGNISPFYEIGTGLVNLLQ